MQSGRLLTDRIARNVMFIMTVFCSLLVCLMALGLYLKSHQILAAKPLGEILLGRGWHPLRGEFGFYPFIMGTMWVTGTAIVIAVPLSILTAIYLAEYAGKRIRQLMRPVIDLLAGIPSVVYGVWGVLVIVPLVKNHFAPALGMFSSGYTVLSAGIVLAVMVLPVIIHVSFEVICAVPVELRQASLALGATKWQTVKRVVLRKAMPGLIAANVLGLTRAFGETMAVLMVAGNVARVPKSVMDPAYPLPALIANNYGEVLSIPMYDSALLLAALILFTLVFLTSLVSRIILLHVGRSIQ